MPPSYPPHVLDFIQEVHETESFAPHSTESGISLNQQIGSGSQNKIKIETKNETRNCINKITGSRVKTSPSNFVQFKPAKVDLICSKGISDKREDPSCKRWFEESIQFIRNQINNNHSPGQWIGFF